MQKTDVYAVAPDPIIKAVFWVYFWIFSYYYLLISKVKLFYFSLELLIFEFSLIYSSVYSSKKYSSSSEFSKLFYSIKEYFLSSYSFKLSLIFRVYISFILFYKGFKIPYQSVLKP